MPYAKNTVENLGNLFLTYFPRVYAFNVNEPYKWRI